MKSKGFLSVAVIVVVLAILVLIYYLKFEKVPAHKQQTDGIQTKQLDELPPPTKEQVEQAKEQLSKSLNSTKRQMIELSPEGYDTLKIVDKFAEFEVAMIEMRVKPHKVINIPNVIQEFMQDSVLTDKETDRILRLMDKSITGKK